MKSKKYRGLPKKAAKKAAKHKPDWPQMFADRIIDLENRVAALERAQTNPIPNEPVPPEPEPVVVP